MSPGLDSLIFGEVFLLLFILSIWVFSVYSFIKRYQVVLSGSSVRDVPFYKSTVFNRTNDNLDNHSLVPLTSFVETRSTCDCSDTNNFNSNTNLTSYLDSNSSSRNDEELSTSKSDQKSFNCWVQLKQSFVF